MTAYGLGYRPLEVEQVWRSFSPEIDIAISRELAVRLGTVPDYKTRMNGAIHHRPLGENSPVSADLHFAIDVE